MKKLKIIIFKGAAIALLIGNFLSVQAQKLPNVQQASVRAPANIKIDGKATEWDNKFNAYNNATNVFYTLSNDNDNLYLTVQATDLSVVNKIIRGGVTFTVNKSGKKGDKNGISITYPIYGKAGADKPHMIYKMPEDAPGSKVSAKHADSFMYVNNRMLGDKSKHIMTTGIAGLDTIISVYNEDGIKAIQAFDNKMVYTYELAVSLKHLRLDINNPEKFAYNFKLNGLDIDNILNKIEITSNDGNGNISFKVKDKPGGVTMRMSGGAPPAGAPAMLVPAPVGLQKLTDVTDFWGEYTLAKL